MGSSLSSCSQMVMLGEFEMAGVDARTAWETFSDLEGSPSFVPHILSIERLCPGTDDGSSKAGASWNERRLFAGNKEIVMRKTVTRFNEDHERGVYEVQLVIYLDGVDWYSPDAVETCTFAVEPFEENETFKKSSIICWTMAFVPAGSCWKIWFPCIKPCILKSLYAQVDEEMQYYYKEAIRRMKVREKDSADEAAASEETSSSNTTEDYQPIQGSAGLLTQKKSFIPR